MGRPYMQYLTGKRIYVCSGCKAHVADHEDIESKNFTGRHGRAFLASMTVNVSLGPREERVLITGLHTVADIQCIGCGTVLGWKYENAYEPSQKYKEGKFIVEKEKVILVKEDGSWP